MLICLSNPSPNLEKNGMYDISTLAIKWQKFVISAPWSSLDGSSVSNWMRSVS